MITPMVKYSFLIYHKEYDSFLNHLQDIGVLHIQEKANEYDEQTRQALSQIREINDALRFLSKRGQEESPADDGTRAMDVVQKIREGKGEIDQIEQELVTLKKDLDKARPWGDFSEDMKKKLKALNLTPRFFTINEKRFDRDWENQYYLEVINQEGGNLYFVILQEGDQAIDIDARS